MERELLLNIESAPSLLLVRIMDISIVRVLVLESASASKMQTHARTRKSAQTHASTPEHMQSETTRNMCKALGLDLYMRGSVEISCLCPGYDASWSKGKPFYGLHFCGLSCGLHLESVLINSHVSSNSINLPPCAKSRWGLGKELRL